MNRCAGAGTADRYLDIDHRHCTAARTPAGTQITKFGARQGGHLGDQVADHIGGCGVAERRIVQVTVGSRLMGGCSCALGFGQGRRMRSRPRCSTATAPARLSGSARLARSPIAFDDGGGGLVGEAQDHDAGVAAGRIGADVTQADVERSGPAGPRWTRRRRPRLAGQLGARRERCRRSARRWSGRWPPRRAGSRPA